MTELDAFNWAFKKAMSACEDRRLDDPGEPRMVPCRMCDGHGFANSDPCGHCDGYGEVAEDLEG